MKKVLGVCLGLLLTASMVCAEWMVDFRETYRAEGIDKAVENALKDGKNPEVIVELGIGIEGLNPQNLVRALFCAGAPGQDIRAAAVKYQISEPLIVAGYEKAIEECRDQVADSQAYTPAQPYTAGVGPAFSTPGGGRSGSFVVVSSPNTFTP